MPFLFIIYYFKNGGVVQKIESLYAPWRSVYLDNFENLTDGCVFCTRPELNRDRETGILYRGQTVFVITNRYPYNSAHLMVIPYRHVSDPELLTDKESSELWKCVMMCKSAIHEAYKPHGYNIGMNVGRTAGAGMDQHCHMHIVPRWNGDTNFMPVIDGTKVISEGLLQTYDKLLPYFINR